MKHESAKELYGVFKAQGISPVYAVRCCGRIYIGRIPAVKCRTCDKPPRNVEVRSEKDLDNL